MYKKVDIDKWNRKEHYEVFKTYAQCVFSMTTEVDITQLLAFTRKNGYKFYPVMIHAIAQVVNQYPEFRMAMKDGELVEWDKANPSYTIFHKETETFSSLWSIYEEDLDEFISNFDADQETFGDQLSYFPKGGLIENLFFISAIPWTTFTSFNIQLASIDHAFTPMFTLGKYTTAEEKTTVPVAIQVHHAICDGFHIARFMNKLQEVCDQYRA